MIINLHVQQLWPLYLLLMVLIDSFLMWLYSKTEMNTFTDFVSVTLFCASVAVAGTISFIVYVGMCVLKIKIVSGL
ncbi:unnamed protein product [Fructobacillus fructosus]|uniref:Uncharacterized protein n=1 Tax=Fructobacillus fructosus TaxID=1631 RepID=A0ABN9YIC2_9LACO|nr:unnamed protein product [Fructobacillus fructosus]